MKKKPSIKAILFFAPILLMIMTFDGMAVEPSMNTYTAYPPFLSAQVKANVMVILDSSGSMMQFAYSSGYDPNTVYDGYFDASAEYSYDASQGYFYTPKDPSHTSKGANYWEGSFLNWVCMRRTDIAKNVLTGGRTYTAGDGSLCLLGQPYPANLGWAGGFGQDKTYDYDGSGFPQVYTHVRDPNDTPYFQIGKDIGAGLVYVATKYYVRVKITGIPQGVVQENASFVNFALAIYSPDAGGTYGDSDQGGRVLNPVGDPVADIVSNINAQNMVTINFPGGMCWTPMAETIYTVAGYFGQDSTAVNSNGPRYHAGDYTVSTAWDPYYSASGQLSCVKSFVILISDGEASHDSNIPASLKTSYGSSGSSDDYLDDVAYWAHTNDIRSSSFGQEIPGKQILTIYTVSTFGGGETLLKNTAKYGGFVDSNNNNLPDLASEWDEDGDGIPDNYFSAGNAAELSNALNSALVDLQAKTAAGSAVSVLATSGEGEGIMVQAYFKPTVPTTSGDDVKWTGYIQALWLDDYGNMREDTVHDLMLDTSSDRIVNFTIDSQGDMRVDAFAVSGSAPYPDITTATPEETLFVHEITPVWEAGKVLSDMADPNSCTLSNRSIFTFIDKDDDGVVDETSYNSFDSSGEVVAFDTSSASVLKPYFGAKNNFAGDWDYLGSGNTSTDHGNRVANLINFIRGYNTGFAGSTDIRSRLVEGTLGGGDEVVWPLGDAINATPVCLSTPPDNYGLIYGDATYQPYYNQYKDRETVVFVGGNDGMLHAFTSWDYNPVSKQFVKPAAGGVSEAIGTELWAYIPQSLLCHLKWLPNKNYTHVYFVDQKPRIVDAKIFTPDADHPNGWGTVLIAGLNQGGKDIDAIGDFDYASGTADTTRTFKPCYFAVDVTLPRSPKLLWERTYDDLGFSSSRPAVFKVEEQWFAVFGSGPTDYDGTSTNSGHIYVVDLCTGDPVSNTGSDWLYDTVSDGINNAFMTAPATVDMGLNYSVDAVFIGETHCPVAGDCSASGSSSWEGGIYKVSVPWVGVGPMAEYGDTGDPGDADEGYYVTDPADSIHAGTNPWLAFRLFASDGPVTAAPSLSSDSLDNLWIYFGTGRYMTDDDKINTDSQYIYGIKDPFFNAENLIYYHQYFPSVVSNLFEADNYAMLSSGTVLEYDSFTSTWEYFKNYADFLDYIRYGADESDPFDDFGGWKKSLPDTGERSVTKVSLFGGIVLATTFVPNDDICGFGGDSYLYGLYYETGVPYYEAVFANSSASISYTDQNGDAQTDEQVTGRTLLGSGMSSSLGIHMGAEEGAKGLIQQSTGVVLNLDLDPAFNLKSAITAWREE